MIDAKKIVMTPLIALVMLVGTASATIAEDIADLTTIIGNSTTGLTGWLVSMMSVFMEPPLIYFVALGFFVTIIGIVASLLLRRGRR